jgi:hypothetical protein
LTILKKYLTATPAQFNERLPARKFEAYEMPRRVVEDNMGKASIELGVTETERV